MVESEMLATREMGIRIVDGQVHIWALSTPERPWPAERAISLHRPAPFSKDDLLREMNRAGVHRALIVPPPWEGWRNDLALAAAKSHPERLAVIGLLDVDDSAARDVVTTCQAQPGMLGLRFSPPDTDKAFEPRSAWLWTKAEAVGLPIMVSLAPAQLHLLDRVAAHHPALKLVIDNLAIPVGMKDEKAFAHLDLLLPMAKHPNVAVELKALPSRTVDCYPYRRLHPYLRRIYDAFGPKRMFWATDLTKDPNGSYQDAITMYTREIPWLTPSDKEWIMGRSLCEWVGWGLS
jgi:L-fuconolactonase